MTDMHSSLKPGVSKSLAQTWSALPLWGQILAALVGAVALVEVVLPVVFGVLGVALGLASILLFVVLPITLVGVGAWKLITSLKK